MITYGTADSRLGAYLLCRGAILKGTETKYHGQEDRVMLLFDIDEDHLAILKREFFEGCEAPALALLNHAKTVMHVIREARELARESVQN